MKRIIIRPLDVLLFRSSRPFGKGENIIAHHGDITPLPFAGAIRSKFLSIACKNEIPHKWWEQESLKNIVDIIGTPDKEGAICFFGSYIADELSLNEVFICPNDIVPSERYVENYVLLEPKQHSINLMIGEYYPVMPQLNGSFYVKEKGGFVTRIGLKKYLLGNIPERGHFKSKDQLIAEERRVGIELDREKGTARKGMIYTVEYIRLCEGAAFSVWVNDSFGLPQSGFLKIGGEGRGASYEIHEDDKIRAPEVIKEINERGRFKLYLSTPAIFFGKDGKNSCSPNLEKLRERLGVSIKLISMLPGKPMRLGGWDMAKRKQKPLKYAVRGGAVYFYEITDGKIEDDIEMPIMVSDVDSWLGLGSTFIGVW